MDDALLKDSITSTGTSVLSICPVAKMYAKGLTRQRAILRAEVYLRQSISLF